MVRFGVRSPQTLALAFLAFSTALLASGPAAADRRDKAEKTVREATLVLNAFTRDDHYRSLWKSARKARALVIVPGSVRAGFLIGASGGNGVMLARRDDGAWSPPSFVRLSSVQFGFVAGGEVSDIVLAVMTERGMNQLLASTVKLGADVGIAAGPVGGGAKAQTADILAYTKSQGLYGSVSVEGVVVKVHNKWNRAYYGREISPLDIVYKGAGSNAQSTMLREAAAAIAQRRIAYD